METIEFKDSILLIDYLKGTIDRQMRTGELRKNIGCLSSSDRLHIKFNHRTIQVHRLIYWGFHGPIPPWLEVDHINGDHHDNRIENLRLITKSGNLQNQRQGQKGSTSGLLGVSWKKRNGKWAAEIQLNGKKKHIGLFDCKFEAHAAYLKVKRELHPACTI